MSDPHQNAATSSSRDHRRHSISAKIVFLVFLCTFSTALVISGIAIRSTHQHLREGVERHYPAALERARTQLSLWLAEAETALVALPSSRSGRRLATGSPAARANSGDRLEEFAASSLHFDALALVSPDGDWAVDRGGTGEAVDSPESAWLQAEDSPRRVVLPGERAAAALVTPLRPGDPEAGLLVARLDRLLLEELLRTERHQLDASLSLAGAAGSVLASVGDGSPKDLAAAVERLRAEAPGTVHEYASPAGVHTLGALLPLGPEEAGNWALVVDAPYASAFAPMLSLLTRIFVIDLAISLVFIVAAYRISSRMLRPIEDLSEGARKASVGNFGQAISDPGTHDEIGRLTRAFNEMMGKLHESQSDLREANEELKSRNEELQRANEVLSQLSITDGLTKLHNHRYFQESLTREIKRQSRNGKPLSVLLVDLDDFKALNDRLGHASGDELLMRVASIMDATVRESDLLARYGGEEFVVLATDTDLEGAVLLAEKIRMAVEDTPHIVNESLRPVRITVSIGVAQYAGNRRRFFEAADRALYRAKGEGKNCVIAAEEDAPSS